MKKKYISLGLLVGLLALSGCGGGANPGSGSTSTSTGGATGSSITEEDLDRGITTYTDTDGVEKPLNRDTLYRNAGDPHVASYSVGSEKSKLLVAPFRFQNYSGIVADDALLEKIRIAFDGTPEETEEVGGYISVSEFYEQSSFDKGAFDVVVLPCWVDYSGSPAQFQNAAGGNAGIYAAEYVRTWYLNEYAKDGHGLLGADWEYEWRDFDADKDGYLDLMWTVYAYPYTQNDTSFWWAYVTYTSNQPNMTTPMVKTLAWASTNFMSAYNGYDSHTFIHETGHTLGLNDYYDYNNTWKPMGRVDYMDNNVGDHNAYSKFALGWINPYILREGDIDGVADENDVGEGVTSAVITLRQSSLSGDALVLASPGYNGTAFDEYLIMELVGPYGLCETDYSAGYDGTSGYTVPGIRLLHVDARARATNWSSYVQDADLIGQTATDIRVSNTYKGRMGVGNDSDYWPHETSSSVEYDYFTEVSLIESTILPTNWTNSASYQATNSSLFQKGSSFRCDPRYGWTEEFFPSRSRLWNKAKTITGNPSSLNQTFEIDESVGCNFNFRVNDIVTDPEYGAIATVTVTLAD